MEEIQSYSENYRSSSSSASSPANKVPSSSFFYLRKPGSLRQPISFEDSPEWEDAEIDVRVDEEGGDSINVASAAASPSLSKMNSGSLPSPPLPEAAVAARKIAGAFVVWKDLTVTIKGKRKYSDKVVKSSNGYALAGTLTVVMGPAKSGKSTLLRAIAGRLDNSARLYGEVFVNGAKSSIPYGSYPSITVTNLNLGYVDRDDSLIGSLTVREMLYYSAILQLPGFFSQKKSLVEDAILAMSLGDYADKLIGGYCNVKGLCRGEKRRVSIARELSSTEVFGLFDRICLLSNGNTLFFGETLACLQDDHGDFSSVNMDTAVAIRTLEATYKSSSDAAAVESIIQKLTQKEGPFLKSKGRANTATRIASLHRNDILQSRAFIVLSGACHHMIIVVVIVIVAVIIIITIVVVVVVIIIIIIIKSLLQPVFLLHFCHCIEVRVAAVFVFVSLTTLISFAGLPAHLREIKDHAVTTSEVKLLILFFKCCCCTYLFAPCDYTSEQPSARSEQISELADPTSSDSDSRQSLQQSRIYIHEELNQHSGALTFILGHFLASIPFLFVISITSSLVFYFLVGMRKEFSLLMYFVLNYFMCLLVNEGLMLVISSICLKLFQSILTLTSLHTSMSVPKMKLTVLFIFQGLLENEYVGTSYAVGQVRTISGVQALHAFYNISPGRNAKYNSAEYPSSPPNGPIKLSWEQQQSWSNSGEVEVQNYEL
ncbi:hypothetical protein ACLOJK_025232 [Asimina triloba]